MQILHFIILALALPILAASSRICSPGQYKGLITGICTSCPAGTISGSDDCMCPVGHFFTTEGNCIACPNGTSAAESTTGSPARACVRCREGEDSNAETGHVCRIVVRSLKLAPRLEGAAKAVTSCSQGYHLSGGSCVVCPAGTSSPSPNSLYLCVACALGEYSNSATGYVCKPCPPGSYSDAITGQAACTACPTGTTYLSAAAGDAYCSCAPGYYFSASTTCSACPGGTSSAGSTTAIKLTSCTACSPGTYSNSLYICTACGAGTYSNITVGLSSCTSCPSGTTNPAAGYSYCICAKGSYFLTDASCVVCADGTGTDSDSTTMSPTRSCVTCSAGWVSSSSTLHICTACPNLYYSSTPGQAVCISCPTGTSNSGTGNLYCTCAAGSYFATTTSCTSCAAGTTSVASTTSNPISTCTSCSVGYGSNSATGFLCVKCADSGKYNDVSTGQGDCYSCPTGTTLNSDGTYCTCPAGSYFKLISGTTYECVSCAAGCSSSASTTSSKITACTACDLGYKSNTATGFLCVGCSAANYYSDLATGQADCYACPGSSTNAGNSLSQGQSYCICAAGYYFNPSDSYKCDPCPAGFSSVLSTTINKVTSCTACDLGYASSSSTGYLCVACNSVNSYSDSLTGQTACASCPGSAWIAVSTEAHAYCVCSAGYYFTSSVLTGTCTACADGYSAIASTTMNRMLSCTACLVGYQSNSGTSHLCLACIANYYSDTSTGQTACYPCPGASHNSAGGSYCTCDAGYYFNPSTCVFCADGYSSASSTTLSKVTSCTVCSLGYQSNLGTLHICTACSEGTYSDSTTTQSACQTCPAGSANSGAGNTYCTCPAGHYFTGGACQACPDGTSSVSSTTASMITLCSACANGYYASSSTSYLCTACPQGTYTDSSTPKGSCTSCPAYYTNTGTGNAACALPSCAAGNHITTAAACVPCVAGTYQNLPQQQACVSCPSHSSSSVAGTVLCTCDSGYYYDASYGTAYCPGIHKLMTCVFHSVRLVLRNLCRDKHRVHNMCKQRGTRVRFQGRDVQVQTDRGVYGDHEWLNAGMPALWNLPVLVPHRRETLRRVDQGRHRLHFKH